MSTIPPPSPGHDGSHPLSEYEQRVLNQLGNDLLVSDPRLGAKLSSPLGSGWPDRDLMVQVGAILVIFFVLLPTTWVTTGIVVLTVLGVPVLLLVTNWTR